MSDLPSSIDCRKLLTLARENEEQGQRAQARAAYSQAADTYPLSRIELAGFLARIGEFRESCREWLRVRTEACAAGDAALEIMACRNLASVCRELGDFTDAHRWQQRAVSLLIDAADSEGLSAQDLIARATDAMIEGNFDFAEELMCRVIEAAGAAGDAESQADAWGTLGLVHGRKGLLGSSVTCLRRAARLHDECGDLRGAAADYLNLAEVFRIEGRLAAARLCLRRATSASVRVRDPQRWSTATQRMREVQRIEAVRMQSPERN